MKVACALQVTAGVTVSSFANLPSRASAESRGVRGPKCRGVNPTTIIASTGFNVFPPCRAMTAAFAPAAPQQGETTCQTGKQNGTLSSEIGVGIWTASAIADRVAAVRRPAQSRTTKAPGEGENAMLDKPSQGVEDVRLQSFSVTYEYPVVFTRDAFALGNRSLVDVLSRREPHKRHRCLILADQGVLTSLPDLASQIENYAAAYAGSMELVGSVVPVPGGEICKHDPETIPNLLELLSQHAIDRHSFTIAIGGGAVLDAVGYASAVFHRGVRHIRFPTTVLAQDDSGVGVKNAVNHFGLKNLIGTFAPPWAIINDSSFIDTLPPREKRAGMAEAVKVALIRDGRFFDWLEAHADDLARFSRPHLDHLIKGCAELHMRQIRLGGDPFEMGSARPLDFGHWSAHKLEQLTENEVNHGEAVAIGIALDTRYSVLSGRLAAGEDERVANLLERLGFVLWHDKLRACDPRGRPLVLKGLADFQEHLGGELTVTLLAGIGRGVEVHEMDEKIVDRCIDWLEQRR
jgi:3-dehydroquinate synthase